MTNIYVASSWRNPRQPEVVQTLRDTGYECYDFRNPAEGSVGFSWRQTKDGRTPSITEGIKMKGSDWEQSDEFLKMLEHPRAQEGFSNDYAAMCRADVIVMVLPCGKSAHLELGWAAGRVDKRTAILLEDPVEPELMYLCADYLAPTLESLIDWLEGS